MYTIFWTNAHTYHHYGSPRIEQIIWKCNRIASETTADIFPSKCGNFETVVIFSSNTIPSHWFYIKKIK